MYVHNYVYWYNVLTASMMIPKYARINTLKGSIEDVLCRVEEEGYCKRMYNDVCSCACLDQENGEYS